MRDAVSGLEPTFASSELPIAEVPSYQIVFSSNRNLPSPPVVIHPTPAGEHLRVALGITREYREAYERAPALPAPAAETARIGRGRSIEVAARVAAGNLFRGLQNSTSLSQAAVETLVVSANSAYPANLEPPISPSERATYRQQVAAHLSPYRVDTQNTRACMLGSTVLGGGCIANGSLFAATAALRESVEAHLGFASGAAILVSVGAYFLSLAHFARQRKKHADAVNRAIPDLVTRFYSPATPLPAVGALPGDERSGQPPSVDSARASAPHVAVEMPQRPLGEPPSADSGASTFPSAQHVALEIENSPHV